MNYKGYIFKVLDNKYSRQYNIVGKTGIVTDQWCGVLVGQIIFQSNVVIDNPSSGNKANFTPDEIQFVGKKTDNYLPPWF